jgi:hypothetical protein
MVKMEVECAPLDLSASSRLKYEYCSSDSEDSDAQNCKAYKKSLMKRYRKSFFFPFFSTLSIRQGEKSPALNHLLKVGEEIISLWFSAGFGLSNPPSSYFSCR